MSPVASASGAPWRRLVRKLWTAAGVITGSLIIIYLLLALSSSDPLGATTSLINGPLAEPARVTQWLSDSATLALTGLATALVFRVGQFSLGAEGQVAMGALASGAVVLQLGSTPAAWAIALLVGAAAGFAFGAIPGAMKAYGDADEIVSSLMLNYIALLLFAFVIKQWLQPPDAGFPVSDFYPANAWMPTFGTSPVIPLSVLIAAMVVVAVAAYLARTRGGFEMRMAGSNLRFATAVGLRVRRSIWLSMALSGAIAGVAGASIAATETHRLILGLSGNFGYDGILVALLAGNRPLLVPLAALAYGYLRTGGDIAQISSDVPRELVTTAQGLLILFVTARFTGAGARLSKLRRRVLSRRSVEPAGPAAAKAEVG